VSELPDPPDVEVASMGVRRPDPDGFLWVDRHEVRHRRRGSEGWSETYPYDVLGRRALDAVGVVLHRPGPAGLEVLLRGCLRPPLGLRGAPTVLWEIPAGLVEAEEARGGADGLRAAALRELKEEAGHALPPSRLQRLGPPVWMVPGVFAEQVHLFAAALRPADPPPTTPEGDGHPVEQDAALRFAPVAAALADASSLDAKTEIALHRLLRRVP
jgi:ADP-ribose pyrophosphatase